MMVEYILNPYLLVNVLWMVSSIIIAFVLTRRYK